MKAADLSQVDQLVEKLLDDEWYSGIRTCQYQHRDRKQRDIRKQIGAQVAVQPPLHWSAEPHVPTISSAVSATRRAAPGAPQSFLRVWLDSGAVRRHAPGCARSSRPESVRERSSCPPECWASR